MANAYEAIRIVIEKARKANGTENVQRFVQGESRRLLEEMGEYDL